MGCRRGAARDAPPYIKRLTTLIYKVLRKRGKFTRGIKKIFRYIKTYAKITYMQKNPGENIVPIEVDSVTGEYYITIPEWIINENGWYEGTTLNMEVDGESIIITEVD